MLKHILNMHLLDSDSAPKQWLVLKKVMIFWFLKKIKNLKY